ncbi:MAG TPA: tryptophan--tRNA ligase [Acidimicrobiales bacterium]|jgi:tryptophanyl-tRNA synthetase|nr:tryptophan--tRNA ligase [Acidimicrobiales bacterium]
MTRVFSGMQPTGDATLGSLLGALRHWVADQSRDAVYCVVDLHALTRPIDPAELRRRTLELATLMLAVGIDPEVATLFVQSHVAEHTSLAWLMQCTASIGELRRMTQFKDKSASATFVSSGLLTYPTLMAADILLYDTEEVPVGDDQRQHVELTRDLAERFNSRYGPVFTVPKAVIRTAGARVMDLSDPSRKMSKSEDSPAGTIQVLEDPASITKKIRRAVTDTDTEVRYDPAAKPGVSNLLSILAAVRGGKPDELAAGYEQYGPLKTDVAEAVVEYLRPIQARYAELAADPAVVAKILVDGADRARETAAVTLERAVTAVGLLPPA